MDFGGRQVWCGDGDWYLICKLVATHYDMNLVCLLLLVFNVSDYAAVGDFTILGELIPMDKKVDGSYLNVPNAL